MEVRLNELYDHVDKFVITEWTETHRGNPKPLFYEENKERFQKFQDKIIHRVIREHMDTPDPWVRENYQRQCAMEALTECQPDDIIMISDLDEIVRPSSIPQIAHALLVEKKDVVGCSQALYRFFLNALDSEKWYGTIASTYGYLKTNNINLSVARLDHLWRKSLPVIENAGWHFSWMGGHKRIVYKLESYAHAEEDTLKNKAPYFIEDQLQRYGCSIVDFDESYPKYILENVESYKKIRWVYTKGGQEPEFFLNNRIFPGNARFHTFQKVLELLNERNAKVCIETGTARHGEKDFAGDGGSTIIFGHWAQENHAAFYSVDINEAHINEARNASTPYLDTIQFIHGDSLTFLRSFPSKIDFLYLDSFDYDYDNPLPSQKHHLEEVKAALPHLTDNSIIMIDDCNIRNGGKGLLAIQFLVEHGWKVIENSYQVILVKDDGNGQSPFEQAEAHKSSNRYREAIWHYKVSVEKNGNPEEAWYSRYQLGECYEAEGEWEEALHWYLEAYQFDPSRPDSLLKIASHYRHGGAHQLACLFAKHGARVSSPDRKVGKFSPIKNYQFAEELSIASYYAGRKEDGLEAINALILDREVPKYIKDQAYTNLQFYVEPLKNARYVTNRGCVAFEKMENGYQAISSKNQLVHFDRDFQITSERAIVEDLPRDRICAMYNGSDSREPENMHLVSFGKQQFVSCSLRDTHPSGIPKVVLCELNASAAVKRLIPLQGPDPRRAEKNWLPFVKDGAIHYIYSFDPFTIYKPDLVSGDSETVVNYAADADFSAFQGAAGPIPFDDGYLVLVHEFEYHRFLWLDKDFLVRGMSLPFIFQEKGACTGMVLDHSGTEVILTVGSAFCYVDLATVRGSLQPFELKPIFKQTAYVPKYVWNLGFSEMCNISPFREGIPLDYKTWIPGAFVDPVRYVKHVKEGDAVWVQPAQLAHFVDQVLPSIMVPFVLVINDGDESFPSSFRASVDIKKLLEDKRILHIFSQNVEYATENGKVSPLPIGIDFHSITRNNGYFGEPHLSVQEQEAILDGILANLKPTSERKKRALVDFHLTDTYIYRGENRKQIAAQITPSVIDKTTKRIPRHELWRQKGEYAFSISPHGTGPDCHRTWEDLTLGCIVIVKTSPIDSIYEGLPVVIVKDWSEITEANMDKWLLKYGDAFTNPKYRERVTHAYWMNQIRKWSFRA